MSTISRPQNPEENPRVKSVFDDIRATRGSDFINNLWYYLAFDPELLENTWRDVKQVMAKPSHLDAMTKELVYAAVSIANSCEYCIHSHTGHLYAFGCTEEDQRRAVLGLKQIGDPSDSPYDRSTGSGYVARHDGSGCPGVPSSSSSSSPSPSACSST